MADIEIKDLTARTKATAETTDQFASQSAANTHFKYTLAVLKEIMTPDEIALSISGATTIDLSSYNRWDNFKLTLTANATIVFTNMSKGQTGYITIVQDAATAYTLSYSGTFHGDTIAEPAIGEKDVHSFILSAIGTASAVEPVFGSKLNI